MVCESYFNKGVMKKEKKKRKKKAPQAESPNMQRTIVTKLALSILCLPLSFGTLNNKVTGEYIVQFQSHLLYYLQVEEQKCRLNWALGSWK